MLKLNGERFLHSSLLVTEATHYIDLKKMP